MHLTTSAADFSKKTLVDKEEETHDADAFERAEAEVVKLLNNAAVVKRFEHVVALGPLQVKASEN